MYVSCRSMSKYGCMGFCRFGDLRASERKLPLPGGQPTTTFLCIPGSGPGLLGQLPYNYNVDFACLRFASLLPNPCMKARPGSSC